MEHLEKIWNELLKWLQSIAPNIIGAILILVIGWWLSSLLSKYLRKAMSKGKVDAGIVSFVYSITKNALRIVVLISTAAKLGVNVTSIIAALGAASVTVGLALKDSMSNVASGVLIIVNKLFHIGDYLEIEDLQGTVTKIEMMTTTLNTIDNKTITIPNSTLTSSNIINYTSQKTRRLDLTYGVGYESDLIEVKNLLRQLVETNQKIHLDPAPVIAVGEFQDSCIQMVIKVWCDCDDYWPLYYEMQESVKMLFDAHHISIPYPQTDVHLKSNADTPSSVLSKEKNP